MRKIPVARANIGFGNLTIKAIQGHGHSVTANVRSPESKNKSAPEEVNKARAKIVNMEVTCPGLAQVQPKPVYQTPDVSQKFPKSQFPLEFSSSLRKNSFTDSSNSSFVMRPSLFLSRLRNALAEYRTSMR